MKKITTLFLLIILVSCGEKKTDITLSYAPADTMFTQINTDGVTITPLGRIVKPRGNSIRIAPHPYGLTISHDGNIAITANSGTSPFSITIIKDIHSDNPEVLQIPEGAKNDEDLLGAVFMGLAVSRDNKKVYVAGGQTNKIYIFDIEDGKPDGEIDLSLVTEDSVDYTHGYIGDIVLSEDGKTLYAVDQIGFRLVIIDIENRKVIENLKTGRYPFGVTLSHDEKYVYVANVGMFEYSPIKSIDLKDLKNTSLPFPAFAYNSKEMREGIKNDTLEVEGLGDPNVPESFSVWQYEIGQNPKVKAKIKTGYLVGDVVDGIAAIGGSSPNSLVAGEKYIYVTNGNNDLVSVIDPANSEIVKEIEINLPGIPKKLKGVIPFGLDLSPDGKRLYVACSGINSIAVVDTENQKTIGFIPTGWFPSKVKCTPDGKSLIVANAKGFGSGPNAGPNFELGPEGSYIGALMKGSVTVMDIPSEEELKKETENVVKYNFKLKNPDKQLLKANKDNPIPLWQGQKESPIKYIVFISKENRTYDEVFGQVEKGKGLAKLARYGRNRTFSNETGDSTVENATVMPNHLKLASEFAMCDNFYVNSDHSADGHRWLANVYPNEWVETGVAARYGGKRDQRINSKAPGNFGIAGGEGTVYPEDYNQHGSMWEHFDRNNIDFFNFGFSTEMGPAYADSTFKYTGVRYVINYPVPAPIFNKSSRKYATYNMAIPDQFRADMFIEEFNEKWIGKDKNMPQIITIILPNDHGSSERPWAGYPFMESYMSDNDLALGRIIEFLSHTKYWKNMAIFITEDDSQAGVDHIDAHRSLLMVVSPYAKRDYVGHKHYSFGSIFKTFWHILGIPYLNQYDFGTTPLNDLFTGTPDFTPYEAVNVDTRVFDPQKALDPFDENFDWKAVANSPKLDDVKDFKKSAKERDEKHK